MAGISSSVECGAGMMLNGTGSGDPPRMYSMYSLERTNFHSMSWSVYSTRTRLHVRWRWWWTKIRPTSKTPTSSVGLNLGAFRFIGRIEPHKFRGPTSWKLREPKHRSFGGFSQSQHKSLVATDTVHAATRYWNNKVSPQRDVTRLARRAD